MTQKRILMGSCKDHGSCSGLFALLIRFYVMKKIARTTYQYQILYVILSVRGASGLDFQFFKSTLIVLEGYILIDRYFYLVPFAFRAISWGFKFYSMTDKHSKCEQEKITNLTILSKDRSTYLFQLNHKFEHGCVLTNV